MRTLMAIGEGGEINYKKQHATSKKKAQNWPLSILYLHVNIDKSEKNLQE